eukprot:366336-Chlamydomonas_euryale.AAC.3
MLVRVRPLRIPRNAQRRLQAQAARATSAHPKCAAYSCELRLCALVGGGGARQPGGEGCGLGSGGGAAEADHRPALSRKKGMKLAPLLGASFPGTQLASPAWHVTSLLDFSKPDLLAALTN